MNFYLFSLDFSRFSCGALEYRLYLQQKGVGKRIF